MTATALASATPIEVTPTATAGRGSCGNGTIEASEECDDGNAADLDGCSRSCRIETKVIFADITGNARADGHEAAAERQLVLAGYVSKPRARMAGVFKLVHLVTEEPVTKPGCRILLSTAEPSLHLPPNDPAPVSMTWRIEPVNQVLITVGASPECDAQRSDDVQIDIPSIHPLTSEPLLDIRHPGARRHSLLFSFEPDRIAGRVSNLRSFKIRPAMEGKWGKDWCNLVEDRDSHIAEVREGGAMVQVIIDKWSWYFKSSSCIRYGPSPSECLIPDPSNGHKIGSATFRVGSVRFEAWSDELGSYVGGKGSYSGAFERLGNNEIGVWRFTTASGTVRWRARLKFKEPLGLFRTESVVVEDFSQTRPDTVLHEGYHELQWLRQRFLTLDSSRYPWETFSATCAAGAASDIYGEQFRIWGMRALAIRIGPRELLFSIDPAEGRTDEEMGDLIRHILTMVYRRAVDIEVFESFGIGSSRPFDCAQEYDVRVKGRIGLHHPDNWACNASAYSCPVVVPPLPPRSCHHWP